MTALAPRRRTAWGALPRAGALTAVALALGCGGSSPMAVVGSGSDKPPVRKVAPIMPVTGHMIASVPERTVGPFLARRGDGAAAAGLVAWVTVAEGSGRRVIVVPVDAHGRPRGAERTVALVPVDTTMLVVRPMRGGAPGFVVAWTSLTDRGESLWSIAVGDDGAPRSKAVELQRTGDDIVWVDVVPTDHGAICLWAEETRSGDANLVLAALNTDGKVHGVASRVARGIVGWHALEVPGGVGISTIDAKPTPEPKGSRAVDDPKARGGPLSFRRVDADGHPIGNPVVVSPKPLLTGNVDVARSAGRTFFAWTDRSAEEPAVVVASLGDDDKLEAPRTAVSGHGGAALFGLAGGPAGAAILFAAPVRATTDAKRMYVARIGPGLVLERRAASFEMIGRAHPELTATPTGFAVLAPVRDCEPDSPACPNANVVTTVLRTDDKGALVQREPLSFGTDPASLGWGLTCDGEACFALTATGGPLETRVRAAEVHHRENAKAPAEAAPSKDGARVVDVTALVTGESVFDLATAQLGAQGMVAMLSSRAEAPRKNAASDDARAATATLSTRVVDDNGHPKPPTILSTRALIVGGVAIAGADKPEDGGAVAWVARENGDPEVHVTRIDKSGKRTNDIQLTTTKGDATDVAIAWAGGGWIVAWVDGRDGNGEVYATKVSPELQRIAREERITTAPGDASDLVALARGDLVWLAWADPRESPRDGFSDIFVTAVKKRDAKRAQGEEKLLATASHSRTPHLADGGDGVHVAWIEEAPMGAETPSSSGYGAIWAKLDDKGKPTAKPIRLALAGEGAATSVAIEPSPTSVRAVVARSTRDTVALDAVELGSGSSRAAALLMLDGPSSLDVALTMQGGVVYFNDEGPALSDRRARRARIVWNAAQ